MTRRRRAVWLKPEFIILLTILLIAPSFTYWAHCRINGSVNVVADVSHPTSSTSNEHPTKDGNGPTTDVLLFSRNNNNSASPPPTSPSSVPVSKSCAVTHSFQDIKRCHKNIRLLQRRDPTCLDSIETWEHVQRCLNGPTVPISARRQRKKLDPKQISVHLVGERSSATKFVIDELQNCFPKRTVGVTIHRDYRNPKHWFQPTSKNFLGTQPNRVVVAVFRDPVEWVAAMIEKPYHSPNHMKGFDDKSYNPIPLEWQDFVTRRWAMKNRTKQDWEHISQKTLEKARCRHRFLFNQVMPCEWENTSLPEEVQRVYPFYELRRDTKFGTEGVPFDNILQLRSEKIVNFLLEIPLLHNLGGYLAVRYEDLLLNGTRTMLEQVAEMIGLSELPARCKPQPPSPERLGRRQIPVGLRKWVDDHLILHTERLLGYRT
jgi:hypothetical protein